MPESLTVRPAPKARHVFTLQGDQIKLLQSARTLEKTDPSYTQKLEAGRARRAQAEVAYSEDFTQALRDYLNFHPRYALLAGRLSQLIAAHAVPVGSGTVARTKRIPIEQRAEAATIAWLRHQTTAYDHMEIPRVKGARREARRMLAKESKRLLDAYRRGTRIDVTNCPLQKAIT